MLPTLQLAYTVTIYASDHQVLAFSCVSDIIIDLQAHAAR